MKIVQLHCQKSNKLYRGVWTASLSRHLTFFPQNWIAQFIPTGLNLQSCGVTNQCTACVGVG